MAPNERRGGILLKRNKWCPKEWGGGAVGEFAKLGGEGRGKTQLKQDREKKSVGKTIKERKQCFFRKKRLLRRVGKGQGQRCWGGQ